MTTGFPDPSEGEPFLLTPGPLTTAYEVKEAMLKDWGSWDDDFRAMTRNLRARLLSLDDLLEDSADRYVTIRESYLQNREFQVYDGDPPLEDDDEFYDEFLEEEDY